MKIAAKLARSSTLPVLGLLLSGLLMPAVFAQNTQSTPPPTTALPPPAMNDPGVVATAPPAAAQKSASTIPTNDVVNLKPQKLPPMKDGDPRMGRPDDSVPDVDVRKVGDATVQEYSRSGQIYMVVVTPKSGIQQTYMVDAEGRWVDEHGQKPVGPVMYKVMEWGKAPPPAERAEPAQESDGN